MLVVDQSSRAQRGEWLEIRQHHNGPFRDRYLHSVFCLSLQGDTPNARRAYDALMCGCIPVLVVDWVQLPFEDTIPWDKISIRLSVEYLWHNTMLVDRLRQVTREEIRAYQRHIVLYRHSLTWNYPAPRPGDAFEHALSAVSSLRDGAVAKELPHQSGWRRKSSDCA